MGDLEMKTVVLLADIKDNKNNNLLTSHTDIIRELVTSQTLGYSKVIISDKITLYYPNNFVEDILKLLLNQ